MKKVFLWLIIVSTIAVFSLAGCNAEASVTEEKPEEQVQKELTPQGEDSTWQVHVEKVEERIEPSGLKSSDYEGVLLPSEGFTFLVVTCNVVNKTNENQEEDYVHFGITLTNPDDCGYRAEDSDVCLPVGIKLSGKMHVNAGTDIKAIMDFIGSFKFAPNSPDGESVEFFFITKKGAKTVDFYFANLQPINISSLTNS
jgi:predicted small lipoprotein YifL